MRPSSVTGKRGLTQTTGLTVVIVFPVPPSRLPQSPLADLRIHSFRTKPRGLTCLVKEEGPRTLLFCPLPRPCSLSDPAATFQTNSGEVNEANGFVSREFQEQLNLKRALRRLRVRLGFHLL